eukprot:scaffold14086_cov131-Isochrysis_galbana.AAC.3
MRWCESAVPRHQAGSASSASGRPVSNPIPSPCPRMVAPECAASRGLGAPDVIGMGLEDLDLLERVVVVHADLHVVRPCDDPLLARHKLCRPNWLVGRNLKRLDERLRRVVPEEDVAVVHGREHPRLRRVQVHRLDAHGPGSRQAGKGGHGERCWRGSGSGRARRDTEGTDGARAGRHRVRQRGEGPARHALCSTARPVLFLAGLSVHKPAL